MIANNTALKVCVLVDPVVCFRRSLDGITMMESYLASRGATAIGRERIHEADFVVVVTCGFNQHVVRSGHDLIRYARTFLSEDRILVMGCLPGTVSADFQDSKVLSAAPKDYDLIDSLLAKMGVGGGETPPEGMRFVDLNTGYLGLSRGENTLDERTYYVRVSSGCAGKCSYCAIRNAIGALASRPLSSLQTEIEMALAHGAQTIYPGADDLGAWGIDCGSDFPTLLETAIDLCLAAGRERVVDLRNVINPYWLVRYRQQLESILTHRAPQLPTLSIAMQSGSSTVLRASRRYSGAGRILDTLQAFRAANPSLYMFGHLIIGLPSEKPSDLNQTLEFVDQSPVDFWTCFRYSQLDPRPSECAVSMTEHWQHFLRQVSRQGYFVKEISDRAYVARRIDQRYVEIDFAS